MKYKIINGIHCYHPDLIEDYSNFPDYGFSDNINELEINFWDRARYRLFKKLIYEDELLSI